jgi:hypothetical protein
MMQDDPGHGDYSKERHDLFATVTLDELLESIQRAVPEPNSNPDEASGR